MQTKEYLSVQNLLSRRYLVIVFFVLLAIAGVYTGENLYLQYVQKHWDAINREEQNSTTRLFTEKFTDYQNGIWNLSRKVAEDNDLLSALKDTTPAARLKYFNLLQRYSDQNISLEIYNAHLDLVGWSGRSGAPVESSYFKPKEVSFILQGQLYSYLVVIDPVRENGIIGYSVAKKLIDVNYPINNRFINNRLFASTFDAEMDFAADFDFSSIQQFRPDNNQNKLVIQIRGNDGASIGYATVDLPVLMDRLKAIEEDGSRYLKLLVCILLMSLSYLVWKISLGFNTPGTKLLLVTFAIWFARYAMIWANFPQQYIQIGLFNGPEFRSPLGFGLARSVGDLFISCLFLFINLIYAGNVVSKISGSSDHPQPFIRKLIDAVFMLVAVVLFFTFTRGFLAAMRSAVVDSTMHYNDPMFVVPPFDLGLMLFSLLLLAVSFVFGCMLLIWFTVSTVRRLISRISATNSWIVVIFLFILSAILYGGIISNPLTGVIERVIFTIVLFSLTILVSGITAEPVRFRSLRSAGIILLLATILVLYNLDTFVHDSDRQRVESIAGHVLRPADSWLTSIVNRSLDDLSAVSIDSFSSPAQNLNQSKMAFLGWSRSILSREGYNCWVGYANKEGEIVSDFHLGLLRHSSSEQQLEPGGNVRIVRTEDRTINGDIVKVYHGYTPLIRGTGELIGGVWVELSADRQELLGSDTPEILQNYTSDVERRFLRNLILTEFVSGKSIYTSGVDLPKERPLPDGVAGIGSSDGCWLNESIDGKLYETYFTPQVENTDKRYSSSWLALSMENLNFRWHIFSILRIVIFYIILILIFAGAVVAISSIRKREIHIGFRAKLLLAFVVSTLIPIGILAYYNRQYAIDREEEQTNKRLHDQTDLVVTTLQRVTGINAPFDLSKLRDEVCGDLANNLSTDFNVYATTFLQATSKPEVFTAELFDSRLSSEAYTELILKKKGFFSQHQTIGNYPYIVGYRPLLSEAGSVIGVVSVPTLYRQQEIDDDIMQRNAFLFGAYALAMLIAVGMGTFFANQISFPVIRLRAATRQIASGDLSVRISSKRKDEFGELENAFDVMTRELHGAQEKMIRAQRELAWKEMAKQVAHEIKNPLTPMKLSVQHLRQAYADGAKEFGTLLEKITISLLEQIDSLSRIASEFSNFARMPERRVKECRIDEIVAEALELFMQNEHIQFTSRLESHGAAILADREEVRRMFINILQNAVQSIERDGKIFVQTVLNGNSVEIEVADTGKGIPLEIRHKLFEPNFSTKSEGMGLGLAIVKKTVDDLGGTITIESEPGLGTKVKITLPIGNDVNRETIG